MPLVAVATPRAESNNRYYVLHKRVCFARNIIAVRLFCVRLASPGTRVAFYARPNIPFVRAALDSRRQQHWQKKYVARARRLSTRFFCSLSLRQNAARGFFKFMMLGSRCRRPPLFQSHRHFYEFGISLLFGPLGASFFYNCEVYWPRS